MHNHYHELLGKPMTAKEVAVMTGFSVNTIRRNGSYFRPIKFDGKTVYYERYVLEGVYGLQDKFARESSMAREKADKRSRIPRELYNKERSRSLGSRDESFGTAASDRWENPHGIRLDRRDT